MEKGSNDVLIETFMKQNELELMDLELYLSARGVVCIPKDSYENEDY